jgi:Trypsin-like peptidase domain
MRGSILKLSDLPKECFKKELLLRDCVLPICDLTFTSKNLEGFAIDIEKSVLAGTAFLIGADGFAITAAHVLDQITAQKATIMRCGNDLQWYCFSVIESEKHPTEDVAIIKLQHKSGELPPSPFFITGSKEYQSKRFQMWSYPDAVAKEVEFHGLPKDIWNVRPDLIFFSGYVHRRMSFSPNPSYSAYVGTTFFELSEVAGSCASGSPIVGDNPMSWNVFAIYVGESIGKRQIGYGVSLEPIASWSPKILGRTISEEAYSTAQRYLTG